MKIKINIPESLNEITLSQYQRYLKLVTDNPDALGSEFVKQKTVEIFCDIDLKDILQISLHNVNEICAHINTLFENKTPLIPQFKLGNYTFGFIPNLEDISYGEFIDLDEYLKDVATWDKAMAVLYRPVTNRLKSLYDIEKYESAHKYNELMANAPIDVVLGATVFFSSLSKELLNVSLNYLEKMPQEQQQIIQERLSLEQNGDGINLFTPSHRATLRDLIALQN